MNRPAGPIFARAVLAFLAMPGIVAYAVPALWIAAGPQDATPRPAGLALLALGTLCLLWCVRDFYVAGRGTLAPWSPPANLVEVGLYRYTRNPMYISVILVLLGWAVSFAAAGLYLYAAAVAVAFHLRVVFGEEPWLARTHGAQWREYASRVPRWFF